MSLKKEKEAQVLEEDYEEVFIDDLFDDTPSRQTSPDERLWQAVLIQALVDATLPYNNTARRQARAILDTEVGVTAAYIIDLCDMAGWDPGFIRKVYKHLRFKKIRLMRKEFDDDI